MVGVAPESVMMNLPRAGGAEASAEEIKATLLLEGPRFEEDAATVYAVVANSTLTTAAYSYVKKIEVSKDGHKAMLALKLQFGGKA
jgi:hypothetical protein